jgi:hypothetical protein
MGEGRGEERLFAFGWVLRGGKSKNKRNRQVGRYEKSTPRRMQVCKAIFFSNNYNFTLSYFLL